MHLLELEQVRHRHGGQEWVPHWHEEWSFGAVIRGQCLCHVAGRPFQPGAGDLIAIAPRTVHTGVLWASPTEPAVLVAMLYVPPAWLGLEGLAPPARSGLVRAPALARRAQGLETLDDVQSWLRKAVPTLTKALGRPATGQMDPADTVPSRGARDLLDAIRAIVLRGGECSVSGLARQCGVSRERIHQVMKRWTGMSPSDYLRTVRLHRAKDMLLAGKSAATVAADCGFADQAHFTRWFRRAFGYTPGDLVLGTRHGDASS